MLSKYRLTLGKQIFMHELSICEGIMEVADAALKSHAVREPRVTRLNLRIGRLTAVVPDSLRFYFDLLTPGTPLEGARLEIEEVPIRAYCADCGASFEIDTLCFLCPACAGGVVEIVSGRELQVVSLETADEEPRGN